jgi:hypothetical protein
MKVDASDFVILVLGWLLGLLGPVIIDQITTARKPEWLQSTEPEPGAQDQVEYRLK